MRILVAADSFKDALSASGVCAAIARGLHQRYKDVLVVEHPLADGGEGTLDILTSHLKLRLVECEALDPLRRSRRAHFGLSADGNTAYIELAAISGLQLLAPHERNPLRTTTIGTGQLLTHAIDHGAKRIVLAIGGSATNDAGTGLLTALGWRFVGDQKQDIEPIGSELIKIASIVAPSWERALPSTDVLSDVDNPLYGPNGAAHMYAKQKGASNDDVTLLDTGLHHFAQMTALIVRDSISPDTPGAGAAGGVGYAALNFLNARMHRGIDYLLDLTHFDTALANSDLVITGEGHIDSQTLHGKLIHGVCARARRLSVPVIALCGKLSASQEQLHAIGLREAYIINSNDEPLAEQLARTAERLTLTASELDLQGMALR